MILIPVCLACQDFLLRQTALRKGRREGIPRAEATTANALERERGGGGREGEREGGEREREGEDSCKEVCIDIIHLKKENKTLK